MKYAVKQEHIHKHYEEDRENWDILATELEKLREEMKNGREAEEVFGIDPKRGMPFFGLLKREIFGKKAVEELKKEDMDFLIDLTKDIVGIIEREVNSIDFWENTTKQKRLKYEILHNLLLPKLKDKKDMFKRRNEIVQKLIELAYHNYGGKNKVILRHQKWIEKKKKEIQLRDIKFSKKEFVNGEGFLYLGNYYRLWLVENQNTPLNFQNGFYLSKKYLSKAKEIFLDWYKERAYEKISERVQWYALKRGFQYNKIKISKAQKRWGSCSGKGNLNFSWRLIMAPLPVIDYVVIHELVHLIEKNHSRAFWNKVKMLMTDYQKQQEWLKKDGHLLRL